MVDGHAKFKLYFATEINFDLPPLILSRMKSLFLGEGSKANAGRYFSSELGASVLNRKVEHDKIITSFKLNEEG